MGATLQALILNISPELHGYPARDSSCLVRKEEPTGSSVLEQ